MQYTVLIPGGFKPPHKGHYDYIKFYLDNPDVKEVRLYIGEKQRDSITLEQTEAMLYIYGLMDHPKLVYRRASVREGKKGPYTNPLADCYDYAEVRVMDPVALGCSSKDAAYKGRFEKYFENIRTGIIDAPIFHQQDDLSATDFRKALLDKVSIEKFLPEHVNESEVKQLFKTDT